MGGRGFSESKKRGVIQNSDTFKLFGISESIAIEGKDSSTVDVSVTGGPTNVSSISEVVSIYFEIKLKTLSFTQLYKRVKIITQTSL